MERTLEDLLKSSLAEKRQNLAGWLENAPEEEKEARLGPCDIAAVQEHIHTLDEALEKAEGSTLGICKICGDSIVDELLVDYTAEVCFSHLSDGDARRLERELELSQVVQRAMLPFEPPQVPGLQLAAFNRPSQIVGGDFYDFLQFQDGRAAFVIGDVAGKGVSAGMLMASAQTALRTLIPDHTSPAGVLRRINNLFAHNALYPTFVTLFLGAYDPQTRTLTYSNAGHNPPLHGSSAGAELKFTLWNPTGPAVGLLEQPPMGEASVRLSKDDLFLLYTDGITEAFNAQGEQFGEERLEASARRGSSLDPKNLLRVILRDVYDFIGTGPLADDITLVAGRLVD